MANSVDHDQTTQSTATDQFLHCLLRPVFPNIKGYYGTFGQHRSESCFFCCCCFLAWRFTQKQIGPHQAKRCLGDCANITKTRLFKYTENFTTKNDNFQIKYSDIFHISARNIDCGYSLEPPRRGGSNENPQSMFLNRNKKIMHAPVNTSFTT